MAATESFLFSRATLGALRRATMRKPLRLASILGTILAETWKDPVMLVKSLALFPKSLAFAERVEAFGAEHVHAEFAGHPATSAWIVGRMTGIPYSVSCRAHDIFVTQALLGVKLKEAAFVRTISAYNIAFLERHLKEFDSGKAVVIRSSVDLAKIDPPDATTSDVFRILYTGSLQVRKGVDDLLKALARLDGNWHCTLIGDGSERKKLEAMAHELGLSDRLTFRGFQPFEEVSAAYGEADVVATPSKYGPRGRTEVIPNVVIETLAHGRPVITTRVSGIPELVRDGETGVLIEPGDVDALVAALRRVRDDPAAARAMATAGRRAVEADFDLNVNAERQLSLFSAHTARREVTQ